MVKQIVIVALAASLAACVAPGGTTTKSITDPITGQALKYTAINAPALYGQCAGILGGKECIGQRAKKACGGRSFEVVDFSQNQVGVRIKSELTFKCKS